MSCSIAKLVLETLGDAVELECFVEMFNDHLFEDIAVQWQWLAGSDHVCFDHKDEMDLEDPYVYTSFIVPDGNKETKQR